MSDELTGFFWSSRAGGPGATNLYVTTRSDLGSPFGNVKLLNGNINMPNSLTIDPSSTGDASTLVFRVKTGKDDAGIDELYSADRPDGGDFSVRTALAELNANATSTVQPFILPDGSEIFFSSSRAGDYDLYRAARSGAGFAAPTAVTELTRAGASTRGTRSSLRTL